MAKTDEKQKSSSTSRFDVNGKKVAAAIAKSYGVKKGEILKASKSADLKVKFADGSIWVIEFKKALPKKGVEIKIPKTGSIKFTPGKRAGEKATAKTGGIKFTSVSGKATAETIVAKVTAKGVEYQTLATGEKVVPPRKNKE